MTPLGWTMAGFGCVLIWSGIRNENAIILVLDVLSGKRTVKKAAPVGLLNEANPTSSASDLAAFTADAAARAQAAAEGLR